MPDILTLIFIVWVQHICRVLKFMGKIGLVFCKILLWLAFVPVINLAMLIVFFFAYMICDLRKRTPPQLGHTKRMILYPTWSHI